MATASPTSPRVDRAGRHIVQLGGQAVHVFRFAAPADLAYEYFCDVPAVFQLLPDALDIQPYGPNRYRLVVGATDGHGHTMAAIFDLLAIHAPGQSIRVVPDDSGPPARIPGLVFNGALSAEAVFFPERDGTAIEYTVDIAMDIPVPSVLRLMPQHFLQNLAERSMEHKMTQMITGFTNNITTDFHAWASGE
ncbi:DUF1997 domain-containing protein [Oscillochloris sp. ZM17-4]|uniref:DUF1997 domain-containing protein n=1 Tax=Oscillochloris sp. ZM17-4 TaxID=2866714 RepID=UPI001C730054|nr:DUF1997 domain-containing protein [Oscillochloris sp. ZM17-4]MBX0329769.1 DUF1997 domain-containing protein [Oscillochloris sp. ZM17-4]